MPTLPFQPLVFSKQQKIQDEKDTSVLIEQMENLWKSKTKKGGVRKFTNSVLGSELTVDSWRFNEWDYSNAKLTLPSYARGLFTSDNKIVCRGYDKFFNINELPSVTMDTLRETTKGPYTVTVKSNGCIAFISGLKDGSLVVCSKHSTGPRDDIQKNHAMAAQKALDKQLEKCGKTEADLAAMLYTLGVTAVAEFCDDTFEEHVLEYPKDKAGLYLHGLNINTATFRTYPMELVTRFARDFGFRETRFEHYATFDDVMAYMHELAKTGTYQGREVEGFVIRCFKGNEDFFFKFKFEEPYLLYRELREVTKQYIRTHDATKIRFGKHKLVCVDYLKFIVPYFRDDPELGDRYMDNHDIIRLRKLYFAARGQTGLEVVNEEVSLDSLNDQLQVLRFGDSETSRYAIATVATIGCGKTTTSLMLTHLFPDVFGLIQNDNINKPVGDKLVSGALEILVNKPAVILDKNNHMVRERQHLFEDFRRLNKLIPSNRLHYVCLNFVPNGPEGDTALWANTTERIEKRGNNHQSIKAAGKGNIAEKIMKGFVQRFQAVDSEVMPDSQFGLVIDLDARGKDSSLENAKTVVQRMIEFAPDLKMRVPTDEEYQVAFEKALSYKPTFFKDMNTKKVKKVRSPAYFGIEITDPSALVQKVDALVAASGTACPVYEQLKQEGRIQTEMHVTLMHTNSRRESQQKRALWNQYIQVVFVEDLAKIEQLTENTKRKNVPLPSGAKADVQLESVCVNKELVCIRVKVLKLYRYNGKSINLHVGNRFPHITLGTVSAEVKPVRSNDLLNQIYEFHATEGIQRFDFEDNDENILKGLPLFAWYF